MSAASRSSRRPSSRQRPSSANSGVDELRQLIASSSVLDRNRGRNGGVPAARPVGYCFFYFSHVLRIDFAVCTGLMKKYWQQNGVRKKVIENAIEDLVTGISWTCSKKGWVRKCLSYFESWENRSTRGRQREKCLYSVCRLADVERGLANGTACVNKTLRLQWRSNMTPRWCWCWWWCLLGPVFRTGTSNEYWLFMQQERLH